MCVFVPDSGRTISIFQLMFPAQSKKIRQNFHFLTQRTFRCSQLNDQNLLFCQVHISFFLLKSDIHKTSLSRCGGRMQWWRRENFGEILAGFPAQDVLVSIPRPNPSINGNNEQQTRNAAGKSLPSITCNAKQSAKGSVDLNLPSLDAQKVSTRATQPVMARPAYLFLPASRKFIRQMHPAPRLPNTSLLRYCLPFLLCFGCVALSSSLQAGGTMMHDDLSSALCSSSNQNSPGSFLLKFLTSHFHQTRAWSQ